MRDIKMYSEAFKLQVVKDLESGRFVSHSEVRAHYGIAGGSTVKSWLIKYGKNHLIPKIVRVESMEEKDQIKELKKRIKLLERALVETKADQILAESYFEILCEQQGIKDVKGYKKKLDVKR